MGFIVALLLGAGLFYLQTQFSRPTLSEGVVGTFTEDNLPPVVTTLLSQSLLQTDNRGGFTPQLATSWTSNDESTNYIFKLKKDIYWTDGTLLKAQDLDLSFQDVQVSAPDDQTISFRLKESFSPFPNFLTRAVFKKGQKIGVGPYKIKSISKDLVFIKKLVLAPQIEGLPVLTIHFYPSERIAKTALKIGEVESIVGISDPEDLALDKSFSIYSFADYNRMVTIFYNTQEETMSDESLRLALSFAAPSIKNETEAKTPISPSSWAFNPNVKDYLDNEEQAKTYIQRVKDIKQKQVVLTSTTSLKNVAEEIVAKWKEQGINAVARVESGIPQNFQALLISQKIPSDPDQYSLWHKLGQTNISHFSNPRIDKDLEDGRKLKDQEVRKQKYQDFQKVLLDHAPATFLYFPKYNSLFIKKKEGEFMKILNMQMVIN